MNDFDKSNLMLSSAPPWRRVVFMWAVVVAGMILAGMILK